MYDNIAKKVYELDKELNRICHSHISCDDCKVKKFKKQYSISESNCFVVYLALELIDDPAEAAKFYKAERKYIRQVCDASECDSEGCIIYKIKREQPEILGKFQCSAISMIIKLLYDVEEED